ncbi:MAG: putative lipid II flippase FtsW [Acidobacteriota bacterium]
MLYKAGSDRILFITVALMTIFGLVMLYSASSVVAAAQHGASSYYFLRQLACAVIGFLLMIALMNVDYHLWSNPKVVRLLILISLLSLVVVLFQPPINGASRWIRLSGLPSFQPSELAKVVVLFFLARFLHEHEPVINRPVQGLLPCLLTVGLFAGLVVVEPDLGQAVCIAAIAGMLLFAAGLSWKYIAGGAALALPAFYFGVMRVPFRWDRVQTFLDPMHDPLGSGWQISQSLTAVGSGGIFGLGLGAGKQKLFFLPEAHSDFIFAIIGEEIGLIGAALTCAAFLVFFFRGIRIALRAPDRFGFYLGLGITLMVVVQAFINVSSVLALMPAKGTALPFMSQGGTALLMNLLASGILLNISHCSGRN